MMKHSLYLLTFPIAYLRIKHSSKVAFDFVIPLLLACLTMVIVWLFAKEASINGENGFLANVLELFQILVGFYIASLTAIATFPNKNLDEIMAGNPPTLYLYSEDEEPAKTVNLTRRRFLALLFGYLAFSSLAFYLVGVFSNLSEEVSFYPSNALTLKDYYSYYPAYIGLLLIFWFYNLITTTFLGLYYLTHRIYIAKKIPLTPTKVIKRK